MAVASDTLELSFEDVVADVPIDVAIQLYSKSHVKVLYGNQRAVAVQNVDYTVALSAPDYDTFSITLTDALIDKIDAFIAADPDDEDNIIFVRRELPYTTDFLPTDGFIREKISKEFDSTIFRFQQLADLFQGLSTADIEALTTLVALANNARDEAVDAAEDAVAAAAGVNLPAITEDNVGDLLFVKQDFSGYELLPPRTINLLSVLSSAERTDVLTGTNALHATINPKIKTLFEAAAEIPGSSVDLTALNGVFPTKNWFADLHTADIRWYTGDVELEIFANGSYPDCQLILPSKSHWYPKGTKVTPSTETGGITSLGAHSPGQVVGWTAEYTSSGWFGGEVDKIVLSSLDGIHVGSRVAIEGMVLNGDMAFTLDGDMTDTAMSFDVVENLSGKVVGPRVIFRIDDEYILCQVDAPPAGETEQHTVTVLQRGFTGAATVHGDTDDVFWATALVCNVLEVDEDNSAVRLDATVPANPSGNYVHVGAFDVKINGKVIVDGEYERFWVSAATITNASPAVVTISDISEFALGVPASGRVFKFDGGTLDAAITEGQYYYVAEVLDDDSFTFSATYNEDGPGALVNTSSVSNTTIYADRHYQFLNMVFTLASQCHFEGDITLRRSPHGGIMFQGCNECHADIALLEKQSRPELLLGVGSWIFSRNDDCTLRVRKADDVGAAFYFDDKTSGAASWGLEGPNQRSHATLDTVKNVYFGGGISGSRYCTLTFGYLESTGGLSGIANNEGQRLAAINDIVGNTVTIKAANKYATPNGDAVDNINNYMLQPRSRIVRDIVQPGGATIDVDGEDFSFGFIGAIADVSQVRVTPLLDLPQGLGIGYATSQIDDFIKIRWTNSTGGGALDSAGTYRVEVINP